MKILIIHRDVGTGSVGKIVEDLYYGIKKSGNDCKIAYGYINKSKIPEEDLISVCNKYEHIFHIAYATMLDRAGFFGRKQTQKLIKLICEYDPDIIHVHGLYGYWIDIVTLYDYLSKKPKIKIINTLHSCWDFTGHCCYFTKANCSKWQKHCRHCPEKKSYPCSLIFDNSFNNYEVKKQLFCSMKNMLFVAPSQWIENCFRKSFLNQFDVKVINNGIDLMSFDAKKKDVSKYKIDTQKIVILGVASCWEDRKGLNDFLELSKIINDEYQVVLVGLNNHQIKKIPSNIIGITRTENKNDLAAIYSCATIFFNPTYEDNYPTVNLEAIACHTPIVTYNTGGSPEILNDENWGIVIPNRDFAALLDYAKKIYKKKIIPDFGNVHKLSNNVMTQKYIQLYESISTGD
mgnify:FL=1